MNIFGRVFGGFLVLISLGWLATIAGIRPGNNSNNQINDNPTASNVATPAKATSGATPATASTAKTSTFNAGNTGTANTGAAGTTRPEVEKNPRAATTPSKTDTAKSTAPAAAPPVAAGW